MSFLCFYFSMAKYMAIAILFDRASAEKITKKYLPTLFRNPFIQSQFQQKLPDFPLSRTECTLCLEIILHGYINIRSYALFIRFHGHPPYRTYVLNLTLCREIDNNKTALYFRQIPDNISTYNTCCIYLFVCIFCSTNSATAEKLFIGNVVKSLSRLLLAKYIVNYLYIYSIQLFTRPHVSEHPSARLYYL